MNDCCCDALADGEGHEQCAAINRLTGEAIYASPGLHDQLALVVCRDLQAGFGPNCHRIVEPCLYVRLGCGHERSLFLNVYPQDNSLIVDRRQFQV